MRKTWILAVALLAAACGGRQDDEDAGGGGAPADTRVPAVVATVARDTISDVVDVTGRLAPTPGGSAALTAPAAGVVGAIRVQVGSRVAAGDLLLSLDVPELAAEVAAKQAEADAADREAARLEGLYRDGITSRRALEEARAAATSAQAALASAQTLAARTAVRSPLAGGVARVLVQPGERVDAGAQLVEVVNADTVDLVAPVPVERLTKLRRGQAARITGEGGEAGARGWVEALSPSVDPVTSAGRVVVRAPNPSGRLLPGAGATAEITVGVVHGLVVPEGALVLQGDSAAVFVVAADSTVTAHRVAVGARRGGRVEITGDVAPGDRVVTTGAFGLADGMHIAPRDSAR